MSARVIDEELSPVETAEALVVARSLAAVKVPIFVAQPAIGAGAWKPDGGHGGCGYWLPSEWEQTVTDPAAVDRWKPGMALCAVMGHVLDLLDVDPRNGGQETADGLKAAGMWPHVYGSAATPSGGSHDFVAPLGVASLDGLRDGLDIKAGTSNGQGRGFAFIAPTVKLSKTTGELGQYVWTVPPMVDELDPADESGKALAEMVRQSRRPDGKPGDPVNRDTRLRDWLVADSIPKGKRYPWLRAYAGWLRHYDVSTAEALELMRRRWLCCEQPADYPMPWVDAEALLADIYSRYAPGSHEALTLYTAELAAGDPDSATEAALDAAAEFARRVELEAFNLRVREAGREKLAAEKSATVELPATTRLDRFLAIPDEDVTYRVDQLWPVGGRVVLAAQHKAGKSTLVANLVRALVDAEPFLGAFGVAPVARVVVVDDELDERMLRRWLRDQGIRNADRVTVVPLRGRLSSFNILDATTRTRWAEHLGRADVLVFDCLRPALDALGLSEDKDAGRFLEALDELTTEAGIPELAVVHHMGHQGERSRGDSRILDWPDVLWRLVKDAEDDEAGSGQVRRYLTAYGRDVDVPESLLGYDPATRRLSVAGGTRSDRKVNAAAADVLASMADYGEPLSGRAIEERMRSGEHTYKAIRAAVVRLVEAGQVDKQSRPGRGGGNLYNLSAVVRRSAVEVRHRTSEKCGSASLDAHRTHYADAELDQVGQHRTSGALDDDKGSTRPDEPLRWDQHFDDATETPADCPSCQVPLDEPHGAGCSCADLHGEVA